MSAGAIAVTAIVVSGVQMTGIVAVAGWLIYKQRVLLAASPKPQRQQDAPDKTVDLAQRRSA